VPVKIWVAVLEVKRVVRLDGAPWMVERTASSLPGRMSTSEMSSGEHPRRRPPAPRRWRDPRDSSSTRCSEGCSRCSSDSVEPRVLPAPPRQGRAQGNHWLGESELLLLLLLQLNAASCKGCVAHRLNKLFHALLSTTCIMCKP